MCGDPGELGARQEGRMGTGSGGWGHTGDKIHVDIHREQAGDGTRRDKGQGAEIIERDTKRTRQRQRRKTHKGAEGRANTQDMHLLRLRGRKSALQRETRETGQR